MKSAFETYSNYFEEKNKEHLAKYLEWKKTRPAKIAQTKALREAKASAKEAESNE
ncbi:hypothetical protein J32TS6_12400 [Virgibacillus pantothenticus]|uniref:hypothetical protein n=1 Tax=Virgibacillus pantothenticus TaxID=1473 RepID=UPI001B1FBC55|nr:hypothetical protein [Virgibacillus pantothenticus]GIP62685.1 hypothetical protein J32TS6_12400 [Virgibacillus pantothenticus]